MTQGEPGWVRHPQQGEGLQPELSPVALAGVLLRHHRLLLGITIGVATVIVVPTWLWRPYNATSVFMPHLNTPPSSRVAGLAAQFGFQLGGSVGESVDFYATLVESHDLLRDVANTQYRFRTSTGAVDSMHGNILQLYGISGDAPMEAVNGAIQRLHDDIEALADDNAGLITLTVKSPWPELAEQLNRRVLELVNAFNLEKRQSQAAAERRFTEARVRQAQQELDSAENAVSNFLERNRTYQSSPRLSFELTRLQRRVDVRQQVYLTVSQAHEEARIEEVRNTPVITVVDSPEGSAMPSIRLAVVGALGLILGAGCGLALVWGQEYLERQRRDHPSELDSFKGSLRSAASAYSPSRIFGAVRNRGTG